MSIGTKEHLDMMAMFERIFSDRRLDKEDRALWSRGNVYQNGDVNQLFLAFRQGVAYGSAISR